MCVEKEMNATSGQLANRRKVILRRHRQVMVVIQHLIVLFTIIEFIIRPYELLLVRVLVLRLKKDLGRHRVFSITIKMVFHINS